MTVTRFVCSVRRNDGTMGRLEVDARDRADALQFPCPWGDIVACWPAGVTA